jgi:two-component system, OmpR family, response regulator QseB
MTVLIVDDDEMMGRSLVRALRRLGHACRVARSVDAALRALAIERPDLLLTDFDLAECCTGADLACWSRNAFHVPVVLMTAHDPARVHDELVGVGMADIDVLSKPFSIDDLASRLLDATATLASPQVHPSV